MSEGFYGLLIIDQDMAGCKNSIHDTSMGLDLNDTLRRKRRQRLNAGIPFTKTRGPYHMSLKVWLDTRIIALTPVGLDLNRCLRAPQGPMQQA